MISGPVRAFYHRALLLIVHEEGGTLVDMIG